ncbi:MAG: N-acetylmuramoyl-L-alanine amidase [Candidatus Krumholzibacteria bacterium]|nr:N-acetylmuramoyl-L-alanine amidase [Candidatus Krumholzibacteria bacterium]
MKRRLRHVWILSFFCALILSGCAAHKPGLEGLYSGLKEQPAAMDARVLTGKVIVIDPGHGGALHGALGADSLREEDVNLGIALYLWGLCKDAGADAHLTRTADRDYLPSGSNEPADDLNARMEKANGLSPDVFISIHHNSSLPVRRDVNKIELYYRASDPGASLELAQDLQLHLARNLGIETSEVKPGNYYVLRSSTARAAVLGEASYLSSPAVEERLKLSEKQRLEAEAYFLGLVEYFSRGVPSIARISPARDTIDSPTEICFSVRTDGGIPIDPASARIAIGPRELPVPFDPVTSTMRIAPDPALPNGTYVVWGSARSTSGATARSRPFTILLARPPRFILPLAPDEKPGGIVSLSAIVLDALGMPAADGTPAAARSIKDGTTRSGICMNGMFTVEVPRELAVEPFVLTASNVVDTLRFAALVEIPRIAVIAQDALTEEGIDGATVLVGSKESFATDEQGRLLIPSSGGAETLLVTAAGYRPFLIDAEMTRGESIIVRVPLDPLFGGVFNGKRIALDPAGGGTDSGGRGSGGLRGASVNLAVARELRDLLERAGASVTLTRQGDEPISAQERVYIVNRSNADLAIGIRHGAPNEPADSPRIALYYPGSKRGLAIAERFASSLDSLPPQETFATGECAGVFLQQTACAACEIYCGPVEDETREILMMKPQWLRFEAERMLGATAAYFGFEAAQRGICTVRVVSRGEPAADASVDIDRLFTRTTDASGVVSFDLIDSGSHLVTVRASDGRSALVMIRVASDAHEFVIELQ